ncbi:MAG: NADPH-dependent glutamate synthase [Candidatus Lokiarchaeota archaeon]|nr:NADPH-dependent glutamate synthase [Candidatus Lokiarchaeota archaeon]
MEQRSLTNILTSNISKILSVGKYTKDELDTLIEDVTSAERTRTTILEKIRAYKSIDIPKLSTELSLSTKRLTCDLKFLKELGYLNAIGEYPRFFEAEIEEFKNIGLFPNVKLIRDNNLCCGCGACESICPVNAISYSKGSFELDEEICMHCGLCFTSCPRSFFPKVLDEPEDEPTENLEYLKEFNYYREILTAQTTDKKIAKVAQDGGIVTSLLKLAFKEKLIDGALVVTESNEPLNPIPILVNSHEDLLKTAGTKYTNSPILKKLCQFKEYKKIAVVGTPCIMKALRKLSFFPLSKPLYENIALKIGLLCFESFDYEKITELLKGEFQSTPAEIKKMDINKGRFIIYNHDGAVHDIPIKKIKKYGRLGCFFCEDLTAIHTDISVGSIGSDAGWSTVFIRTKKGAEFFQKALDLNMIATKKIEDDSRSFSSLSRIAENKLKYYEEFTRPKTIEQEPNIRITNFAEVSFGLTDNMVDRETKRCLQCGNPLCVSGCPVNIKIPQFIKLLGERKYKDTLYKIKTDNLLPAICGRVCPQETQCEQACLLSGLGEPIAIGQMERFIADWERRNNIKECPECASPNGIKVAVIGAGPSGLTCAGELAMNGYDVTIFEAFHTAGGVLNYGIPQFRLPKEIIIREIETLEMLNVKLKYNSIIGKTLTIDDLKDMGFKAFFIGVGAGLPMLLKIPGISLIGVLSANEFLTRTNLMKAFRFPEYDTPIKVGKIVTVIGGGNTALDSARTALRLGAEKVIVVYRRSEVEMPARKEEYHHALEEGIEFRFLTNPVRFIGDENDNVCKMEVVKMKLGEPDDSGRRRPVKIEGSEYTIDTDTVIIGIGTSANPILIRTIPGLKLTKWGYIEADEKGQTSVEGIFAGGDIVSGSATVISAMGFGKRAAHAIDKYLQEKNSNKNN